MHCLWIKRTGWIDPDNAKNEQFRKTGSGYTGQGRTPENSPERGHKNDQKIKQVIHSSLSLENRALTKSRSVEAQYFNASADRLFFRKACVKLWKTCGNHPGLWMDQPREPGGSSSAREATGRSLSRKGSSSDSIVSPSSRGSSDASFSAAGFSGASSEGKETFR